MLEGYGGSVDEGFADRLMAYVWTGAVHAVFHGLDTGDDRTVASGLGNPGVRLDG